jgi:hypothetical protein
VEVAPHHPDAVGEALDATEAPTDRYNKLLGVVQEMAEQADIKLRSRPAFGSKAKTVKGFIESSPDGGST